MTLYLVLTLIKSQKVVFFVRGLARIAEKLKTKIEQKRTIQNIIYIGKNIFIIIFQVLYNSVLPLFMGISLNQRESFAKFQFKNL